MTCATLTLKVPHLAANSDAGRMENDPKQKTLSDYSTCFVYLPSKPNASK
jgi:hypothetical protein